VAEEQKLPQTGSKDGRSALAAGFIGLAGMLSLLGFKKRKKN
jgi:LPXTG-motif cell wall-anchored protein